MSGTKACLIGCGILALLGLLAIALIVWGVAYLDRGPEGLAVALDVPLDVTLGDTFTMAVALTNERTEGAFNLSDIDLSENYLRGFAIISAEPSPKTQTQIPFEDGMSFTFDTPIPPGETSTFTFTLRAESAGIFRGDVYVYEGIQSLVTTAQTVVKDKPSADSESVPE